MAYFKQCTSACSSYYSFDFSFIINKSSSGEYEANLFFATAAFEP